MSCWFLLENRRISGFRGKELTEADAIFFSVVVLAIILFPDGSVVKCPLQ